MSLTAARELPAGITTATPAAERPAWMARLRIAIMIPCHDEEHAIAHVVSDLRQAVPEASIFVFDNNSSDNTIAVARAAGAEICREPQQGKGHVVRRMFADIEADVYLLIDGDDTYDAATAPEMIRMLVEDRLDMVTGTRVSTIEAAYRRGHRLGNRVLTGIVRHIFGDRITDMLSGYRVFSRRFVKSFPALSTGFETETEFTIHALELNMPLGEVETAYKDRPAGSASKLRTYVDGVRILRAIVLLVKEERPLQFFSAVGAVLLLLGLALGLPVVVEYWHTHLVPRLPTAVLAAAFILLAFLSTACGLILDSVALARKEAKRLAYLRTPLVDVQRPSPAGEAAPVYPPASAAIRPAP